MGEVVTINILLKLHSQFVCSKSHTLVATNNVPASVVTSHSHHNSQPYMFVVMLSKTGNPLMPDPNIHNTELGPSLVTDKNSPVRTWVGQIR